MVEAYTSTEFEEAKAKALEFFGVKPGAPVSPDLAKRIVEMIWKEVRTKYRIRRQNPQRPMGPTVMTELDRTADRTVDTPIEHILREAMYADPILSGKFIGQVAVGPYTLDFAFPHVKLCVEADGRDYHYSPAQIKSDQRRTQYLAKLGWIVKRFNGSQITRSAVKCVSEIRTIYLNLYDQGNGIAT